MPRSRDAATGLPRGIEVMVKKASVDPAFRSLLLARRADAAAEIGLQLTQAEAAILNSVPQSQIEATIDRTVVHPLTRSAFLGKAAAVMVAALGAGASHTYAEMGGSEGIRPDRPPRPPRPDPFVVYVVADYKGKAEYGVGRRDELNTKSSEIARTNGFLRPAHSLANRSWKSDPRHEGIRFPMVPPGALRCKRVAECKTLEEAELLKQQKQADADARLARKQKQEQERLAALPKSRRELEEKQDERLREAHKLFEEKLKALLAGEAEAPRPPQHRVTKGIRPDRP